MPKNIQVLDIKPKNSAILDIKSKMNLINEETVVFTETRTTRVGEPYGLLLTLTHPTTESFTATRL